MPPIVVPVRQSDGTVVGECTYTAGLDAEGRVIDSDLGHIHGTAELAIPPHLVGRKAGFSPEVWGQLSTLAAGLPLRYVHQGQSCSLGGLESLFKTTEGDGNALDFTAKIHRSNPGADQIYKWHQENKLRFSVAYDYVEPGEDGIIRYINLKEISITDDPVVPRAIIKVLQSNSSSAPSQTHQQQQQQPPPADMTTPMDTGAAPATPTEAAQSPAAAAPVDPATAAPQQAPRSAVPSIQEMARRLAEAEMRTKQHEDSIRSQGEELASYRAKEAKDAAEREVARTKQIETRKRVVDESYLPVLRAAGVNPDDAQSKDVINEIFVNPDNQHFQTVFSPFVEQAGMWRTEADALRAENEYLRGIAEAHRGFGMPPTKRIATQSASSGAASHAPLMPSDAAIAAMQQRLPSGVPRLPPPIARSPQTASSTPAGSPPAPQEQAQQQQHTGESIADIVKQYMQMQSHDGGLVYGNTNALGVEARKQRMISVKQSNAVVSERSGQNLYEIDPMLLKMALAPVDEGRYSSFFSNSRNTTMIPSDENDKLKMQISKTPMRSGGGTPMMF